MDDAITRLEKWKNGHKARSASIDVDNGYGATCWRVELKGQNSKQVMASEVSFWCISKGQVIPDHLVSVIPPECSDWDAAETKAYDEEVESKWGNDWPGLAATIHAALDRAEKLGL